LIAPIRKVEGSPRARFVIWARPIWSSRISAVPSDGVVFGRLPSDEVSNVPVRRKRTLEEWVGSQNVLTLFHLKQLEGAKEGLGFKAPFARLALRSTCRHGEGIDELSASSQPVRPAQLATWPSHRRSVICFVFGSGPEPYGRGPVFHQKDPAGACHSSVQLLRNGKYVKTPIRLDAPGKSHKHSAESIVNVSVNFSCER